MHTRQAAARTMAMHTRQAACRITVASKTSTKRYSALRLVASFSTLRKQVRGLPCLAEEQLEAPSLLSRGAPLTNFSVFSLAADA